MLAFHNDPKLRTAMLREMRKHQKADQIISGTYGKMNGKWKGCAVGCSIHSLMIIQGRELDTANHMLFESEAGIPVMLARLQDTIFEGLNGDLQKKFPVRFWSAIQTGADLSCVGWQFLHWLLTRSGIEGFDHSSVKESILQCANVIEPLTRGLPVSARAAAGAAEAARAAAWAAAGAAGAARAAWAAAEAARAAAGAAGAARAAWAAAEAARAAAWAAGAARAAAGAAGAARAAWAARAARAAEAAEAATEAAWAAEAAEAARAAAGAAEAARAARAAAYSLMADQFIELLKAAPMCHD